MMVVICVGIIVGVFFGDLWIKNQVERKLVEGSEQKRAKGLLLLRKHHNRGMVLNVGEKKSKIVAVFSAVLTVMALFAFVLSLGQRGNHLLRVGLSLLLGGGFSNTYDRLKRKYVVDYVSFNVRCRGIRRIVFNCSDFCIMIGALLIALGAGR